MPRTIIVANQKGGVGKTTTVMNLGAAFARLGLQTALIDLDPQAALTVSFGIDPYAIRPSTHDLLMTRSVGLVTALLPVGENLFLAPANAELVATEYKLVKESGRITRLRTAICESVTGLDVILVDTPPSLGLLTVNALVAANELLIPVATDYLAMRGVRALLESVWLIRNKANPGLTLLALVPTLYRPDSIHSDSVVAEMRKVFKHKVSATVIPLDNAAAAAPAARKSVLDFDPSGPSAAAYLQLAEELIHA